MWRKVRIVFVILILFGIFILSGYNSVNLLLVKKETIVPQVTGMELKNAKKALRKSGLKYDIEYTETYDYPDKAVFYQHPKKGDKVLRGFTIKLYVSRNDNLSIVPDLTGLDPTNCRMVLNKAGLELGNELRVKGRINLKDRVVFQKPSPFQKIERGSVVDIYINDGVMKKEVIVPYVLNNNVNYVRSVSSDIGLALDTGGDTRGIVVYQSLIPGDIVKYSSTMKLGLSMDRAGTGTQKINILPAKDYTNQYKFYNLDYTLPNFFGKRRIKVTVKEGTEQRTLLSTRLSGGARINKLIKYSTSIEIKIYINGISIEEMKIQ